MKRAGWQTWTWCASGNFWDSRLGKALRHGLHTLLLILIALVLISAWPRKITGSGSSEVTATVAPPVSATATTDKIIASHLFGQALTKRAVATAAVAASIALDGIVAAGDPKDSIVALTLNGKSGEFHVGDELPDGETLTAIGADSVELTENGTLRHIALAHYGTPDSEGPAAYAALIHGIGLSNPSSNNNEAVEQDTLDRWAQSRVTENPGQAFPTRSVPVSDRALTPAVRVVHLSPHATPLEQLQALRSQLIHPQ